MSQDRTLNDADLHAYVDNELDSQGRAAVEAWLAEHPDDRARVAAYRAQNDALHDAFDPVLDNAMPQQLLTVLDGKSGAVAFHRPLWMQIAAALVLLVLGGTGGWALRGAEPSLGASTHVTGFVGRAVGAHVIYASEVRHPVEVSADQERHLVGWLSKRLGRDMRPPSLRSVGFDLVGGRLLPDHGVPAAQFMYEDASGARVTVYVREAVNTTQSAFRFTEADGASAFYWMDADLSYALVGAMGREQLLVLSRVVYEAMVR